MKLQYTDVFDGGKTRKINAEITTEHCASSYGLPVVLLPDGNLLDAGSWVLLGYKVVSVSPSESPLVERWIKNLYAQVGLSVAASALGKLGGSAISAAKAKSSRANGKLGGRPKKPIKK